MRRRDSAMSDSTSAGERAPGRTRKPFSWKEESCSGVSAPGMVVELWFSWRWYGWDRGGIWGAGEVWRPGGCVVGYQAEGCGELRGP